MKMRWIIGVVAIFWMAGLLGALYMSQEQGAYRVDRVEINDVQQKMQQEYQKGGSLPEKIEGYDILWSTSKDYQEKMNDNIVQGRGMADITVDGRVVGKVCWDGAEALEKSNRRHTLYVIAWSFSLLLIAMVILLVNIYLRMIRPFQRLKNFSERVAMGDLDFPIVMERNNYFGAFTTSFDVMREELKRAKEAENEAQRSKRELVAQLSHDIKTPISSISANCELLQVQIKDENERKK